MEYSDLLLVLIIVLIAYFILRISSLANWMRTSIYMKKESGGKYSLGGDDYGKMMEEKMRLKKHRIALRKAKSNRPGKKI